LNTRINCRGQTPAQSADSVIHESLADMGVADKAIEKLINSGREMIPSLEA